LLPKNFHPPTPPSPTRGEGENSASSKESMVEHELWNRWKRSHLGKLELNRTPLS
jgi:hypothetical protein